jgi:hypothetical protein
MHYREAVACEFSPEKIHVGEYDDFLAEAVDRIPALQLMIDSPSPPKEKYCFARLKVDKKGPSRDASAEEYDLIKKAKVLNGARLIRVSLQEKKKSKIIAPLEKTPSKTTKPLPERNWCWSCRCFLHHGRGRGS